MRSSPHFHPQITGCSSHFLRDKSPFSKHSLGLTPKAFGKSVTQGLTGVSRKRAVSNAFKQRFRGRDDLQNVLTSSFERNIFSLKLA